MIVEANVNKKIAALLLYHQNKIIPNPLMTGPPNWNRIRCNVYAAILNGTAGVHSTLHCVLALKLLGEIAGQGHCDACKEDISHFFSSRTYIGLAGWNAHLFTYKSYRLTALANTKLRFNDHGLYYIHLPTNSRSAQVSPDPL